MLRVYFSRRRLWLTLAAVFLVAVTLRLSAWQFDRAEQKLARETAAAAAVRAVPQRLDALPAVVPFVRVEVRGRYLPAETLLLDNRVSDGRVGYEVLTPLRLADEGDETAGRVVMVNRGWIAAGARRSQLPDIPPPPSGEVTVRGVTAADSADAFVLSDAAETGVVRQNLDLAQWAAETGRAVVSVVILKEADAGDEAGAALVAVSVRTDFKSAQSTVYAWQWLSFAVLTIIFYALLWRKK